MQYHSIADVHVDTATALLAAYRSGVPMPPISTTFPHLTINDAYLIQQQQVDKWRAGGTTLIGWKVGLTSQTMQRQLGVSQPDSGVIRDDMYVLGDEPLRLDRFIAPRIEPEIAFVLGRDLTGPGVTLASAIRAVDFVLPAMEIIDSRIQDWKITIVDTVADNASSGAFTLGGRPYPLDALDLSLVGCNLYRNGELRRTGAGGAVLGSPLFALVWLANDLGRRGHSMRAGEAVLAGSLTAACPLGPGETWTATFANLGSVTARTAAENR